MPTFALQAPSCTTGCPSNLSLSLLSLSLSPNLTYPIPPSLYSLSSLRRQGVLPRAALCDAGLVPELQAQRQEGRARVPGRLRERLSARLSQGHEAATQPQAEAEEVHMSSMYVSTIIKCRRLPMLNIYMGTVYGCCPLWDSLPIERKQD